MIFPWHELIREWEKVGNEKKKKREKKKRKNNKNGSRGKRGKKNSRQCKKRLMRERTIEDGGGMKGEQPKTPPA